MITFLWFVFIVFVAMFVVLSVWLVRQKDTVLHNRDEMFGLLNNGIYSNTNKLHVLAGEANIGIYDKLCSDIEDSLKRNINAKAVFIVGPELSYLKTMGSLVDKETGMLKEGISDEDALRMHPLFELAVRYPSQLEVYLKTVPVNERHFGVGDNFIYVEKPHKPLAETSAMFIENPNPLLRRKYERKCKESFNFGVKKICSADDVKTMVKFGHPVSRNEIYS